jgi:hypothetical protein
MLAGYTIEDNSEAVATIHAMAAACGFEGAVCGRTYDMSHWFRMIATAVPDRWRAQYRFDGKYYGDERTVMGGAASFDTGQAVTSIISRIVYKRLESEVEAFICAQHGASWRKLAQLVQQRRDAGLERPLPWFFDGFQDDIVSVLIDGLGPLLDLRVGQILAEYGVELSRKPSATLPHAAQWEAIGALYVVTAAGVEVRPRAVVQERFQTRARDFVAATSVSEEQLSSFAGLMEFIRRFVDLQPAGAIYRPAAAARRRLVPLRLGDAAVKGEVARLLSALTVQGALAPAVDDPVFYAPPTDGFNGDASGYGYGVTVHGWCCFGAWPDGLFGTIRHYKESRGVAGVSISPLELIASVLGVWLAEHVGVPKRSIMFNDNESAVVVATRCRAHSAPMGEALQASDATKGHDSGGRTDGNAGWLYD